ncbi:MAG TPA: hypothetical protein VIB98_02930 [Gemmatimonadaceae bacterium]
MSAATGCLSTQRVPFSEGADLGQISGVTTRSGREIQFADKGASISNDTLYAQGRTGQLALPTDSIARLSSRHFSAVRTAGLLGGIAAGLFGAVLAAYLIGGGWGGAGY